MFWKDEDVPCYGFYWCFCSLCKLKRDKSITVDTKKEKLTNAPKSLLQQTRDNNGSKYPINQHGIGKFMNSTQVWFLHEGELNFTQT